MATPRDGAAWSMRGSYKPLDPVALSTNNGAPNQPSHAISSAVVGDNAELLCAVAELWFPPDAVTLDATYGEGVFWRRLPPPTYAHDRDIDGVDLRALPHDDSSIDVVVLDPPYRPAHGSKATDRSRFAERYGLSPELNTIRDVLDLYQGGIDEAYRVLRVGGVLAVKCQDLSYSERLHLVTLDVLRLICDAGFDLADQFVLVQSSGRITSSRWRNQRRARRTHSVMWVAVKPTP